MRRHLSRAQRGAYKPKTAARPRATAPKVAALPEAAPVDWAGLPEEVPVALEPEGEPEAAGVSLPGVGVLPEGVPAGVPAVAVAVALTVTPAEAQIAETAG